MYEAEKKQLDASLRLLHIYTLLCQSCSQSHEIFERKLNLNPHNIKLNPHTTHEAERELDATLPLLHIYILLCQKGVFRRTKDLDGTKLERTIHQTTGIFSDCAVSVENLAEKVVSPSQTQNVRKYTLMCANVG